MLILDGGLTAPRPLTPEERRARRATLRVVLGDLDPRRRRLEEINQLRATTAAMFVGWANEAKRIKAELRRLCAKGSE